MEHSNVPSLFCIFHNAFLGPFQVLDIGGEGDPDGGVHVDVLLVGDVLLVNHVRLHPPLIVLPLQDVVEPLLKVFAVAGQVGASAFTEQQQLTLVSL